jgi:heme exporter protein B
MPVDGLQSALSIARKDLAIEFRTRSAFYAAVVFSILAATIFHFAWDSAGVDEQALAPAVIWVIFVFSGLLGLQRSFSVELADRALDGLLASPVDRTAIFAGKMAANCVFVLAIQLVAVPAVIVFYNLSVGPWLYQVAGVMILATLGLTSIGTLFSSMAVNTRLAELMLPMLALPFFLPVVAMSARASEMFINPVPGDDPWPALRLLLAFDLVFVSASAVAFPLTIED